MNAVTFRRHAMALGLWHRRPSATSAEPEASENRETLLVVDDEPNICSALVRLFRRRFDVVTAPDAATALSTATALHKPLKACLIDYCLPDQTGLELAEELRRRKPVVPIVVFSAHHPGPALERARASGVVQQFWAKPFDMPDPVEAVARLGALQRP
jgi:CheY-like chemotaxis protein